jgi:hypothetical protein
VSESFHTSTGVVVHIKRKISMEWLKLPFHEKVFLGKLILDIFTNEN